MKHRIVPWVLVSLLLVAIRAGATTHVVQFGGALGESYSPSSLSVTVGDTITWEGDFSAHPLSSVTVPNGAATFHNASGTVFSYVVTVAGSYDYQCDFHASLGMTGSFTATVASGVRVLKSSQPKAFALDPNYPNPFNPSTVIPFELPAQAHVNLDVFNVIGQKVASLVNETVPAGSHSVVWKASNVPSGVYFCRFQAGEFAQTRRMVLVR